MYIVLEMNHTFLLFFLQLVFIHGLICSYICLLIIGLPVLFQNVLFFFVSFNREKVFN